jgi:zeta-carotene desaturase
VTHADIDAVVVGGGVAGVAAATAMAERGVRVLLLEGRPTLGGRATAFTDPATGERVDNGQHVLLGCYTETFRLLRRLGTEALVSMQDGLTLDVVDRDGHASRLQCPNLPSPLHLLAGLIRWDAVGWRDRLAAARIGFAPAPRTGETVTQWLERLGQTPRLVELLWEPLAVAALNQPIDEAEAAPFAIVVGRILAGRRSAALGLPRRPLDELYAVPGRGYIEAHGGSVRTGAVARIEVAAGAAGSGGSGPSVTAHVGDETLGPRVVVCAVAWHALAAAFPGRPSALEPVLDAAERTGASPIVTVNLWFDRAVSPGTFVGLPGRAMQWAFDKRAIFGESASHMSLVSSGAEAIAGRSNQELTDLALAELRAALPDARAAIVKRAVVVREKRATFSVAPGQPPRPGNATTVPGLFLAGDWIGNDLPATIEGAAASGHAAADLAVRYLHASRSGS